ncbi:MAG TPA: hypothetical protein VKN74_05640 [Candidatus Mcinerneyibacterium sp.]|nr:hypothetical protein [Candidatus Mcinerneyibacterium sp.]
MNILKKIIVILLIIIILGSAGVISAEPNNSSIKSFMFSLLIPGAGQYNNGQKLKGNIFLFVEVLAWSFYTYSSHKNDLLVDKYISYADNNFYYEGDDPERKSYTEMYEILKDRVYANVNLPYTKTGEYYELIGKLDELNMFWDESWQQNYYYDMRQKANKEYKLKNLILGGIIINHVVSGIDALIGANNKGISLRSSLNLKRRELRISLVKSY